MIAIAAIPPATDSPIIDPVPRPPPLSLLELVLVSVCEGAGLDGVGVNSMKLVTTCPEESVVATAELVTACVVAEAAAEDPPLVAVGWAADEGLAAVVGAADVAVAAVGDEVAAALVAAWAEVAAVVGESVGAAAVESARTPARI